ncbi:hypothetical protein FPANT_11105 [Fusarium pseudoanthophilum]|uniref:Uncharacterized protein n=1 Tax=Fusarium pseudoanthophilum TaxID=48495 RepID=A0A8H5NR58_9HYPO|nr:hypothetical protein FPANT_11105 [Fusarium pseudoanthophilum]
MKTIAQQWRPQTPLTLDYVQNQVIPTFAGMRFRVPPKTWAPGIVNETIDASNDLIIVCRLPELLLARLADIESVGILHTPHHASGIPSMIPPWNHVFPLANLVRECPRLRVLYIIVKPEDISPQQSTMTNYHRDYTQTIHQFPPKTFNARQRIYYEVPEVMCRDLESTYQVAMDTSVSMRQNTDLSPLVIRVMTWKPAPGVRGRFDRH